MKILLQLLLLSSVLVSFSVCIHSQIKHYPNVTLDTCGIGRQSLLTTKNCFKWSSNVTTSVQNGRLAQPGEWPWIVFITTTYYFLGFIPLMWNHCTGVILNTNWIITAAHCIRTDRTMTLRTVQDKTDKSHTYGVHQWFIHTNYTINNELYDIALLKLNSHIGITRSLDGRYYTVNGICLPDNRHGVNIDEELALFAAFGKTDPGVSNTGPLRTGWLKFQKSTNNRIEAFRYPVDRGIGVCQGDSGGPLIQYVLGSSSSSSGSGSSDGMNRAVLIGVVRGINNQPMVGDCLNLNPNSFMGFIRVSNCVNWIVILLSSVLVSFSVCIHSQIKHYPNVTLDTCGIGRQSLLTTKNFFKWSSNDTMDIQNGRPAKPGELPWIVFIEVNIKPSIWTQLYS
ncbi:chymotrypsin-like elastase family member 2A [Oppia nitens]|uniref:chymotrypsin-like elastase family member 2A n=1 Tax=Oppia nitens TaxID=1686743 RepID=UPI0023DC1D53|nr:chymotrypsin-like elastase family member 2A [Oppia nitens]